MEFKFEKVTRIEEIAQSEPVYDLNLDTTNLEEWGLPVTFEAGNGRYLILLCPYYIASSL